MRTLANVFPLGISGSFWRLSDADEAALREHGFSEGEIAEFATLVEAIADRVADLFMSFAKRHTLIYQVCSSGHCI